MPHSSKVTHTKNKKILGKCEAVIEMWDMDELDYYIPQGSNTEKKTRGEHPNARIDLQWMVKKEDVSESPNVETRSRVGFSVQMENVTYATLIAPDPSKLGIDNYQELFKLALHLGTEIEVIVVKKFEAFKNDLPGDAKVFLNGGPSPWIVRLKGDNDKKSAGRENAPFSGKIIGYYEK